MDILERLQAVEQGDEVLFDAAAELVERRADNTRLQRQLAERQSETSELAADLRGALATIARLNLAAAGMRAENERLRAALTDAINSMERGGFNVDLQFYLRRTLGQHTREETK